MTERLNKLIENVIENPGEDTIRDLSDYMKNPEKIEICVYVEGGLVQDIRANAEMEASVWDQDNVDNDGLDSEERDSYRGEIPTDMWEKGCREWDDVANVLPRLVW